MIGKQRGETVIETVIMQVQLQAGFINQKSKQDTPCTLSNNNNNNIAFFPKQVGVG